MRSRLLFTTRAGGVSAGPYAGLNLATHVADEPQAVARNRARLAARLGSGATLQWMEQVHGNRVAVLDRPQEPAPVADALVTTAPGLAVAVCVADCLPLLLADAAAGVAAAVHVGRAGLMAGVVPAALATMAGLGARPDRLTARLGPCIGACCYEVPGALRDRVAELVPGTAAHTRTGTPSIDLRAGVHRQLTAAGVADIAGAELCTAESPRHYSYRRDGRTGRFAGVVMLVG